MDIDPYEFERLKELYKYSPESLSKEEYDYVKNFLDNSFKTVSDILSKITGSKVTYEIYNDSNKNF